MNPEILQFIAKKRNCWHVVKHILEDSFENDNFIDGKFQALCEIFNRLNEADLLYGLKRLMASNQLIKSGLTLMQQRQWLNAQSIFNNLFSVGTSFRSDQSQYHELIDRSISEQSWIEIQKQLNQWDDLQYIAEKSNNLELKIDIQWMQKQQLEQIQFQNFSSLSQQKLVAFFKKFKTNNLQNQHQNNEQNEINDGIKAAISEWKALPKIFSQTRYQLLLRFQNFVEVDELVTLKLNIPINDSLDSTVHEIMKLQENWRERLPHKWENLTTWKSILEQRNFSYSYIYHKISKIIKQFFSQSQGVANNSNPFDDPNYEGKALANFHDKIQNNLKYFQIERYFQIQQDHLINYPIAISSLQSSEIYLKNKELLHYYGKIVEQTKTINFAKLDDLVQEVLKCDSILADQSAEILRTKASVLYNCKKYFQQNSEILGKIDKEINNTIQFALSKYDLYFKIWKNWNYFCLHNGVELNIYKWKEYALKSLPFVLKYKASKTRLILIQIFYLMSLNDAEYFVEIIQSIIDDIQPWTWFIFLPNLMAAIQQNRQLKEPAKAIIKKYSQLFPFVSYYQFRGFGEASKNHIYYEQFRQSYQLLFTKMDDLFEKCLNHYNNEEDKYEQQIINEILKGIELIYQNDNLNSIIDEWRDIYDKILQNLSFCPSNFMYMIFPYCKQNQNSENFLEEIQGFKLFIYNYFKNKNNTIKFYDNLTFIEICKLLPEVEMPGQYYGEKEPFQEKNIRIIALNHQYEIIQQNGQLKKKISFLGNNQKYYYFTVKSLDSEFLEQSFMKRNFCQQLKFFINQSNNEWRESSVRYLQINMLHEFFLPNNILLTEEPANSFSASDIFEMQYPPTQFNLPGQLNFLDYFNPNKEQLPIVNNYLCGCVSASTFKNFILSKVKNWEEYFGIREEALKSFAMSQYSNIFILQDFLLEDLRIDLNKGIMFQYQNRYPQEIEFNYQNDINKLEKFRFSRNFINFLTSYGIEGVVASAFISTSDALTSSNQIFVHYLFTFIFEIENIQKDFLQNSQDQQQYYSGILSNLYNFISKISSKKLNNGEVDFYAYTYIKQLSNIEEQKKLPLFYKPWF